MISIKSLASGSQGNAYIVDDGKTKLMIECGISFKQIKCILGSEFSEINHCLVTHAHQDHARAVSLMARSGRNIYCTQECADGLGWRSHRHVKIEPNTPIKINTWGVRPFSVEHDVPAVGFVLYSGDAKVLFLTDTAYCRYKFNGLTHLMIEANYSRDILDKNLIEGVIPQEVHERVVRSHMSIDRVLDFLNANDLSRLQEIHLLHLSDTNSDESKFVSAVESLTGVPTYAH